MDNSRSFEALRQTEGANLNRLPSHAINEALTGLRDLPYNRTSTGPPPDYLDFGSSANTYNNYASNDKGSGGSGASDSTGANGSGNGGEANQVAAVGAIWAQMDQGTDATSPGDSSSQPQAQTSSDNSGPADLPDLAQMLSGHRNSPSASES